jgi:hypothetical protein
MHARYNLAPPGGKLRRILNCESETRDLAQDDALNAIHRPVRGLVKDGLKLRYVDWMLWQSFARASLVYEHPKGCSRQTTTRG